MNGLHLVVDFLGCECDMALLQTTKQLSEKLPNCITNMGLTVVGSHFHQFEPEGVTGVVLLAESHVCLHTWPAQKNVTLDVYVCNFGMDNTKPANDLVSVLATWFKAKKVIKKDIARSDVSINHCLSHLSHE